jgi:hypothetical protein
MALRRSKKVRVESFSVDGVRIEVELRLDDHGQFVGTVAGRTFQHAIFDEWRKAVGAHLEETRRLTWKPHIHIAFEARVSRWDNHQRDQNRQEVTLDFDLLWVSDQEVVAPPYSGDVKQRREAHGEVDEETCEPVPIDTDARRTTHWISAQRVADLLPFTPERWRRLRAIAQAIAEVRRRIAEVVDDSSGKRLDALQVQALLGSVKEDT